MKKHFIKKVLFPQISINTTITVFLVHHSDFNVIIRNNICDSNCCKVTHYKPHTTDRNLYVSFLFLISDNILLSESKESFCGDIFRVQLLLSSLVVFVFKTLTVFLVLSHHLRCRIFVTFLLFPDCFLLRSLSYNG